MYKVISFFEDLKDMNHPYNVGDVFPRVGLKVSEERLKELSTKANRRGMPLIEKVAEPKAEPKEEPEEKPKEEPKRRKRKE